MNTKDSDNVQSYKINEIQKEPDWPEGLNTYFSGNSPDEEGYLKGVQGFKIGNYAGFQYIGRGFEATCSFKEEGSSYSFSLKLGYTESSAIKEDKEFLDWIEEFTEKQLSKEVIEEDL